MWWVETADGERGGALYVYEVEPGDSDIVVYADSERCDGTAEALWVHRPSGPVGQRWEADEEELRPYLFPMLGGAQALLADEALRAGAGLRWTAPRQRAA